MNKYENVIVKGRVTGSEDGIITIMTPTLTKYQVKETDLVAAPEMSSEEAWNLAIKLRYMDFEDKVRIFNLDPDDSREAWLQVMENMSPETVRCLINKWEDEKQMIRKNDIVTYNEEEYLVLLATPTIIHCVCHSGETKKISASDKRMIKTGRQSSVDNFLS